MPDDKNDDLIKKLTEVAGDLSRIIAVHEHRINQQEKHSENIQPDKKTKPFARTTRNN